MDINLQFWTSVVSNSVFIVSVISRCPHKTARLFPKLVAFPSLSQPIQCWNSPGNVWIQASKVVGWGEGLGICELTKALETNANKNCSKTLSRIVGYNVSSKVTDKCVACCFECKFSLLLLVFLFSFSLCFPRRFLARIGIRRSTKLDFGLPTDEEDSNGSEYSEVRN